MSFKYQRIIKSILFISLSVWIILSIMIYFGQNGLVFVPSQKYINTPELYNLKYENHILPTSDGNKINAWWVPHKNPRATLLFFHGNGGNISTRLDTINIFHQLELSVFIIDYRGYGQSTGSPSEQGTYIDAETAWQFLKDEKNIDEDRIIIFGRSLGGAVAIWLAEKYKSLALVVESSFTSIVDMGKHNYPLLPISLLAKIIYPSDERIVNIETPILFIHSKDDDIIPYKFGRKLFELAKSKKTFLEIDGSHNDGFLISGNHYIDGIDNFIKHTLKQ